ncbi:MAG: hypothetical protein ACRYFX_30850 [Janthinobacterium lividum]
MTSDDQLNAKQYAASLQQWVDEVVQGRLWEKHVDLHLDTLDTRFRQPGRWVEVSLLLLPYLSDLIDKNQYELLLAIPLALTKNPVPVQVLSLDDLEHHVGLTPPSFYLFPLHSSTLIATLASARYLPILSQDAKWEVYFKEEKEQQEYNGVIFLQMPGNYLALPRAA